jgi:YidC/Oxa1 family membrane protein insertase
MANKELSPELRILLAFALSFIILLISRPLLVRQTPPSPGTNPNTNQAKTAAGKAPAANAPAEPAKSSPSTSNAALAVPAEPAQGKAEEEVTVEGDLYKIVFSTRGASVKSWTLKKFHDQKGNPLELVNPEAAAKYGDPLSIWVENESLRKQVNGALFLTATGDRTLHVPASLNFEYRDEHIAVRKRFEFAPSSYLIKVETDLASDGKPVLHQIAWRGSFGDIHDIGARGSGWDVFYRDPKGVTRRVPGNIDNRGLWTRLGQWISGMAGLAVPPRPESVSASGQFQFAGIEDRFFCAAFLPQSVLPQSGELLVTTFEHSITLPAQSRPQLSVGVGVGSEESPSNRFGLYVGPKDVDVLAKVQPALTDLINYGTFWFIAKPLFLALRWMHDHVVSNYGWAIILLTVLINMLLFPLKISSLRSMRKMQQIAPQMRSIQDKYKQMKLNDPRRQQMSQETMELYKKHGVNPLGGCLPMILQLPFLYGFYEVLIVSIEMRQAPWIRWWVPDLSSPEPYGIKFLPLLMCGTQFLLQRMSPTPSPDPAQQRMMQFMPILMLGFFYYLSSGLVLYWLTGNLVSIAQQWYINKTEMKQAIEERRSAAGKKKRK